MNGFNRRQFLQTSAGLVATSAMGQFSGVTSASPATTGDAHVPAGTSSPNVLILQPDQHLGTVMGCAGDRLAITPHLDRLASQGIRFSNAASCSPVCSPFRGTMQTGMYCHKHGVWTNNLLLDPDYVGIAEVFGSAGYATGYIGKWHLDGFIPKGGAGGWIEEGPRRQGWQEWYGYEKGHRYIPPWRFNDQREKVTVEGYEWEPDWHTAMTLDFIKRQKEAGKPWCYYTAYGPPHVPEQCPDKYLKQYDPRKFPIHPDARKIEDMPEAMQMYYAQVTGVDAAVGNLMRGLDELGVADNTIVIYISDHGDLLGAMGKRRGKARPHENAFRIPCIIRWPRRIKAGQVNDTLVASVDLVPTILGLAGLTPPEKMKPQLQGVSMAPWCIGEKGPKQEHVYLGLGDPKHGWRAAWDGRNVIRDDMDLLRSLAEKTDDPARERLK